MMVLRTLLMIPSAMAFRESLPFSLSLRAMASWMPVSMMSSVSGTWSRSPEVDGWIGLDVGIDQVPHVGLVGLDVQLLSRVLLDGRPDLAVELDVLREVQPLRRPCSPPPSRS